MKQEFTRMQKLAGLITESQSPIPDSIKRMEDVASKVYLNSFKTSISELIADWYNEGFEKDDILNYVSNYISENYHEDDNAIR